MLEKGCDEMGESTFGYRLETLLKEKGITRKEFKDDTGISLQSISNYLNGNRRPDCEMVSKIAVALNVSADYLLGLSEIPTRNQTIREIHDETGLWQNAIATLMTDKVIGQQNVADFVSFLIANENFEKLVEEIEKLSALYNTTTGAALGIGRDLYDIDFEAAFKLIVTDIFWEIVRGYNNPLRLAEEHHPIAVREGDNG